MLIRFISIVLCVDETDECSTDPCGNGGTCTDGDNTYSCECATGYKGTDCGMNTIKYSYENQIHNLYYTNFHCAYLSSD